MPASDYEEIKDCINCQHFIRLTCPIQNEIRNLKKFNEKLELNSLKVQKNHSFCQLIETQHQLGIYSCTPIFYH